MDSYPEDLLVGVFPLVFAVNAIHSQKDEGASLPKRSLFDRFLDAMAASLIDEEEADSDKKRNVSLFQPDEEESSDDEDLEEFGGHKKRSGTLSAGLYTGFGRRNPARNTSADSANTKTSYAKALTHGQGFFQRARIESVSTKHGFPPSKDPEGTQSLAYALAPALKRNDSEKLATLFQEHPLDGILPAGWLEKHVHALPSVILVVCTVCASQKDQDEQDHFLYQTIEHLHYSLVPKRQCKIQVIGLMQDDVTMIQGDEWSRAITNHAVQEEDGGPPANPPFHVTLLRGSSDLQSNDTGLPTSQALRRLHRDVRDASLMYYLGQARRMKQKLSKLTEYWRKRDEKAPPDELLPLAIRYCFKIAMFYEFQWKHEKSLKFMAEAYRHATNYYRFLIRRGSNSGVKHDEQPRERHSAEFTSHAVADTGESVEVALAESNPADAGVFSKAVPSPPDDMVHQCRAVADWLNLKLLLAGFGSHTEGGLLAATNQWRQHCRVFCTRRNSVILGTPEWFEWSYIAHQRLVVSQLLERHPPRALGDLGNEYDEVLLRCSPWRTYEASVEALLCLAREIDRARKNASTYGDESEQSDPMRPPYVGGLGGEGLNPKLRGEYHINHREKAHELVMRAISLFERELEREKRGFYAEDRFSEHSSSRTGARLYYLAGGILRSMDRHSEAVTQLEKATKFSQGWRELELSARKMLIECYEKHIPSQSEASEGSQTLASMILDSYFNAEMLSHDLRRALNHFASMRGGESLKWYHATTDEEDSNLPFSFQVNFPKTLCATIGDTVKASVLIKSNLDYAVHVNSVVLMSLAGELPIPTSDLLSATNVSEGSEGKGIIIQRKGEITISTELELPKDLTLIVADDSGNGGEMQGTAGKGSFAKSARPRTAGITSAGGARLVSEGQLSRGNSVSQGWNLRFLGGKPLRCDGLRLEFYPVQVEKIRGGSENVTLIELLIEKKKPKTAANIKRTPFEEENYIASAWSRPQHLPFSRGPRSIRVLGPQPQLVITDMTTPITNGKVLEGTVNRILLKLESGPNELCTDLKFKVSCFSVLVTPEGSTKRLVMEEELTAESESSVNMKDPRVRSPVLVMSGPDSSSSTATDYGYEIPPGWTLADSGQGYSGTQLSSLKNGESTFMCLDLFRPSNFLQKCEEPPSENLDDLLDVDSSICKTDFYVTITYRQERPAAQKQKRVRRTSRRKPMMSTDTKDVDGTGEGPAEKVPITEAGRQCGIGSCDEVTLDFSGSVRWTQPLSASFAPGTKILHPCGNRHPSNTVNANSNEGSSAQFALVDGESATLKCTIQTDNALTGLKTEIAAIRFQDNALDSPMKLSLRTGNRAQEGDVIYKASSSNPYRALTDSSKLSVSYAVQATLKNEFETDGVSSSLGAVLVDWLPSTISLPSEAQADSTALGNIRCHGPLALETPSTVRFPGPSCYLEKAPFEAELQTSSSAPRVAVPFELNYRLKNKTHLHQKVTVNMLTEAEAEGLLVSGLIDGELTFAPLEMQTLSYTVLATRAGKLGFPTLSVSSVRYKSWVINKKAADVNRLYVFP